MTTKQAIIHKICERLIGIKRGSFMNEETEKNEEKVLNRHAQIIYGLTVALINNEASQLAIAVKERSDDPSLIHLADALLARINAK